MRTLLFADDSKSIREFCKQELEDEGYRVILARDGAEAIHLARKEHPDLAILDLCMPRVGGFEAVERIKATDSSIPIIFFTANDDECVNDHRSRLAAACVEKGENLEELKRTIVRLLSARDAHQIFRAGLPCTTSDSRNAFAEANGAPDANLYDARKVPWSIHGVGLDSQER